MATLRWVSIGSGNGLLADGTKPLPRTMLFYHQRGSVAFVWDQCHWGIARNIKSKMNLIITSLCIRTSPGPMSQYTMGFPRTLLACVLCCKTSDSQANILLTPAIVDRDNKTNQYYVISDVTRLIWVHPMNCCTVTITREAEHDKPKDSSDVAAHANHGVSYNRSFDCLFNGLFRLTTKNTRKSVFISFVAGICRWSGDIPLRRRNVKTLYDVLWCQHEKDVHSCESYKSYGTLNAYSMSRLNSR